MAASTLALTLALALAALSSAQQVSFEAADATYISPLGSDDADCGLANPCLTLGGAAKKTADGGTINVRAGVYSGSGNFIDLTFGTPKNLSVKAYPTYSQPSHHVFDARGEYATMRVGAGNTLQGLEFRGVRAQTVATFGIVWATNGAEILNCRFIDNGKGLGLTNAGGTSPTRLEDTFFDVACTGKLCSSGVGIDFVYTSSGRLSARNITMRGDGKGTAISFNLGEATFDGLTITNTGTAINAGSAAYGDFELKVDDCRLENNGAAFYSYGFDSSISKYSGRAQFTKCSFAKNGNNGARNGPAINAGPQVTVAIGQSTFDNNNATAVGSTSAGQGGAIYCGKLATINVQDSSFTNNQALDGSPSWCAEHCAFAAENVRATGNQETKNTGTCKVSGAGLE